MNDTAKHLEGNFFFCQIPVICWKLPAETEENHKKSVKITNFLAEI